MTPSPLPTPIPIPVPTSSTWNSLEIAKLIASFLTPLLILLLGILVTRLSEQFKTTLWANQKVIEKRIAIYDKMAPLLNDLYCYYCFVGSWKELTPPDLIVIKRTLDKQVYVYAALFSDEFRESYFRFIHLCFETYSGPGYDAKLRTYITGQTQAQDRRRASPAGWDDTWDQMFSVHSETVPIEMIKEAYNALMASFSKELGIGLA